MKSVWYYPIEPGLVTLTMPVGARPLYVAMRQDSPVVYMLVDPAAVRRHRVIFTVGTGHEFSITDDWTPVGVFKIPATSLGDLMFHTFVGPDIE